MRTSTLFISFIFIFSGCAFGGKTSHDIEELGPPLLRLTSAVHGVAERPDVYGFKPGGSGEECIRLGIEDDPSLLVPFKGLVVKAKCENKNAVVLVCDPEGKKALFEDVGCTSKIDYRAEETARDCDFFIQVEAVCK
jgi:hypothetical protein